MKPFGSDELSSMPKKKTPTGPMETQSAGSASTMPIQVLWLMDKAFAPSLPAPRLRSALLRRGSRQNRLGDAAGHRLRDRAGAASASSPD